MRFVFTTLEEFVGATISSTLAELIAAVTLPSDVFENIVPYSVMKTFDPLCRRRASVT